MKKVFITSIFALALVLGSTAVANAELTSYMGVGSTGAQVSELQTWLITNGFDIPAITTNAAAKGYFGQQTKAALIKYQSQNGIPSTGFFGPLTLASVKGKGSVTMTPFVCPIGYTCTPQPGTVVAPTTPVVSGVLTPGTDGSLTVSLSSFAGNNTIKKGETKDIVAVKLQATAAPVAVTRFDVRLNSRPYLYFSTLTLKDSNGAVLATKNVSSAADVTEITADTDYLARFDGINFVVTPGTDRTLVVSATVLANTDKLTSDVSVIASVPTGSIRTINGKGYTDSLGLGTVAVSGTSGRTITLSSSGSTGNIVAKLDAMSPDNRIVTTSNSSETTGVVLGKYTYKAENQTATISTLKFTLGTSNGNDVATFVRRLYITDGSRTVQADSVATTSTFSNLNFVFPKDEWKTVTLMADIARQDTAGFTAGTILTASTTVNTTNIVGIDTNYTTVTASAGNVVAANTVTFLTTGASVTVGSSPVSVANVDNGTSAIVKKTVSYKFTVNNTGNNDIYVSTDPQVAVGTTSTFTATSTSLSNISGGASRNGDVASAYIVAAGTTREFTVNGVIDMTRNNTDKEGEVKITAVYFGSSASNANSYSNRSTVSSGLDSLTSGFQVFP